MNPENIQLTKEMKERAAQAKSTEELIKIASEYGLSLTEVEAQKAREFLSDGELSDEELAMVSGGKGRPSAKYQVGQRVRTYHKDAYYNGTVKSVNFVDLQNAWYDTIQFDMGDTKSYPEEWVSAI